MLCNSNSTNVSPRAGGVLWHAIATATMVNGWMALLNLPMTTWVDSQVGGHFQYLTINGLFAAIFTMTAGGVSDLLPGIPFLRTLKRSIMLIALPLGIVISGIYWSLLTFAPTLILPPKNAASSEQGPPTSSSEAPDLERIPLWIDLSLHAVPAIALFIEFYFREKKYRPPVSTIGAIGLSAFAGLAYSIWVEHCAAHNGTFPYPFLTNAPFPGRVAIYAGATLMAFLSFKLLNGLHR